MSRITRYAAYTCGGLAALAGLGVAGHLITSAHDKAKYPPLGRLVDIGGYRLHIRCLGTGRPVVVLESGSGNFSLDWSLVHPQIAQFTQVCSYDRAGHGWSDASPHPRTVPQIVEELRALLMRTGLEGPFILVGHSLGGLYMQYFARRYSGDVAGIVLIDSTVPDLYSHFPQALQRKTEERLKKMWMAAQLGLLRLGVPSLPPAPGKLHGDVQQAISSLWLRPAFWQAGIEQNKHLNQNLPNLFNLAGPFPDIPVTVLTPSNADWTSSVSPDFPALWLKSQEKLADLSSRGRFIRIEESSHSIHHDEPETVVEVVHQMVQILR